MANKKVDESMETTVNETVEDMADETEETETIIQLELYVERRPAKDNLGKLIKTKDKEQVYNYILPIELRGRKFLVNFVSIDKGGFIVLDMVYGTAKSALLYIKKGYRPMDGKKTEYTEYYLQNVGEDGILYEVRVKPDRQSDTDLLKNYINVRTLAANKAV